jgi:hypothetical protein
MFENRVLRRIFGPKREGGRVVEGWRKLHNEDLQNKFMPCESCVSCS